MMPGAISVEHLIVLSWYQPSWQYLSMPPKHWWRNPRWHSHLHLQCLLNLLVDQYLSRDFLYHYFIKFNLTVHL